MKEIKEGKCHNCAVIGCTLAYRGISCKNFKETSDVNTAKNTNADRIRAMSDEELAKIFTRYAYEAHGKWYGPDQKTCWSESKYALDAWIDWLRKPAEED